MSNVCGQKCLFHLNYNQCQEHLFEANDVRPNKLAPWHDDKNDDKNDNKNDRNDDVSPKENGSRWSFVCCQLGVTDQRRRQLPGEKTSHCQKSHCDEETISLSEKNTTCCIDTHCRDDASCPGRKPVTVKRDQP